MRQVRMEVREGRKEEEIRRRRSSGRCWRAGSDKRRAGAEIYVEGRTGDVNCEACHYWRRLGRTGQPLARRREAEPQGRRPGLCLQLPHATELSGNL